MRGVKTFPHRLWSAGGRMISFRGSPPAAAAADDAPPPPPKGRSRRQGATRDVSLTRAGFPIVRSRYLKVSKRMSLRRVDGWYLQQIYPEREDCERT